MTRPLDITARTMQILSDRLHKVDDKNKTPDEKQTKCTNAFKWFGNDQCDQYYMVLEIHIPGECHANSGFPCLFVFELRGPIRNRRTDGRWTG